jgi:hypothetical protein
MAASPETWFQRVVWTGIFANVVLAVPTLLWPDRMLALSRLPAPTPIIWVQFAALLLILLSLFYVPAAIDMRQWRPNAWLSVVSRLAGVVFFFTQARAYWLFGLFDLVFFVPLAFFLLRSSRS